MQQSDITELFAEIDFLLREGVDLSSSDTESTIHNIKLLSAAAVYMNRWLRFEYGGHEGQDRGPELLDQIIAAPFQTWDGEEVHPDPFEKAAMLWRGITQGHPFGDGNKRAGFALASYFLSLVGFDPSSEMWNEEEVYSINIQISAGELSDVGDLMEILWRWWGVVDLEP